MNAKIVAKWLGEMVLWLSRIMMVCVAYMMYTKTLTQDSTIMDFFNVYIYGIIIGLLILAVIFNLILREEDKKFLMFAYNIEQKRKYKPMKLWRRFLSIVFSLLMFQILLLNNEFYLAVIVFIITLILAITLYKIQKRMKRIIADEVIKDKLNKKLNEIKESLNGN